MCCTDSRFYPTTGQVQVLTEAIHGCEPSSLLGRKQRDRFSQVLGAEMVSVTRNWRVMLRKDWKRERYAWSMT